MIVLLSEMEDVSNEHFSRELMGTKSTSVDTTETHILEQAIETVYNRPETHGEPEDTFGNIANVWSWYLDTEICDTDVAKMFILMKIARSKEGHYDEDNPEDVAGYAENWARLMEE